MKYIRLPLIVFLSFLGSYAHASKAVYSLGYTISSESGDVKITAECANTDQATYTTQPWQCSHFYSINGLTVSIKIENNEYRVEVADSKTWSYSLKESGTITSIQNPKSYKDFSLVPASHIGNLVFKITQVNIWVPKR